MPAKDIGRLCRRCNNIEATLIVRAEPVCGECLVKYIQTKVVKRMESFRTRNSTPGQSRPLLLPVSFGISSVCLLHLLDQHLQSQKQRTGRSGFSLRVVHVITELSALPEASERLKALSTRYPNHSFSLLQLPEILRKGVESNTDEHHGPCDPQDDAHAFQNLQSLLFRIPSATSKADVLGILQRNLVIRFAKEHSCEGIVWGHSTTTLAEKILAETAKGRGFSVPWQMSDGESPYGIAMYYPLRDVLRKELVPYLDLVKPALRPLMLDSEFKPTQAAPSAKSTTIDVLMKQYFGSVEESYPSIVSNVVRTAGKLESPDTLNLQTCHLCKAPIMDVQVRRHDLQTQKEIDIEQLDLCYGCARSMPPELVSLLVIHSDG